MDRPPRCIVVSPIIASFVPFLLLLLVSSSVVIPASAGGGGGNGTAAPFRSGEELLRLQRIKARLARTRDASVKTIQSPDGDVIDCVPTQLQPAFEHPKLRGHRPEREPAERPGSSSGRVDADDRDDEDALPQVWRRSGESCPEGTIPVRRTTEAEVLRASSVGRFGMKARGGGGGFARRDSTGSGHEHAVGYVSGGQFYGAKASLNVWPAQVASPAEFSLSQIWVISGAFGNDLNTIEAGWQVSPQLYGDNNPRFFTYWTVSSLSLLQNSYWTAKQMPCVRAGRRVPGDGLLQPALLGVRADEQPRGHRRRHLADLVLRRAAVRHHRAHLEGPAAGPLVAAARRRRARRLLAVLAVHAPGLPRRHGAVRRRGRERAAGRRAAHAHADGLRPLPRGRLRARRLLPQRAGRRLGQQPRARRRAPAPRRPAGLLRHRRRQRRCLGHLLLLRRAWPERAVPIGLQEQARK
ncbi:uncharacterized protein LOC120664258 isoform X1 [Panicum virgatum]|uniref:uncharacterized protein LOC120664258 isoform X1 n=1 Tax=Panicum virgatum TaxID=38727 RepID=UPI0019D6A394|nr:uncharacterized protein LOC120664258 isoform X1 [Panicum virgatum]